MKEVNGKFFRFLFRTEWSSLIPSILAFTFLPLLLNLTLFFPSTFESRYGPISESTHSVFVRLGMENGQNGGGFLILLFFLGLLYLLLTVFLSYLYCQKEKDTVIVMLLREFRPTRRILVSYSILKVFFSCIVGTALYYPFALWVGNGVTEAFMLPYQTPEIILTLCLLLFEIVISLLFRKVPYSEKRIRKQIREMC